MPKQETQSKKSKEKPDIQKSRVKMGFNTQNPATPSNKTGVDPGPKEDEFH